MNIVSEKHFIEIGYNDMLEQVQGHRLKRV